MVSADVSVQLPQSYTRLQLDEYSTELIQNHFVNDMEQEWVVDAALGLETWLNPMLVLRTGLFTNRSSAPDIVLEPTAPALPQVHLYGASFSLGFKGESKAINVGTEVQLGTGHDAVLNDITALWKPAFSRTSREQFRIVFFVSGAWDFAKKVAKKIVTEKKKAVN